VKPPRWIIPLEPLETGESPELAPHYEVTVTESLDVLLDHSTQPLRQLSPLVACQLGQALQDASAWCGQERARREARKR
jgi:hypothetical protein